MFESSVNSYGRKTATLNRYIRTGFESSVNSYGRKTGCLQILRRYKFESSVNSYGRKNCQNFNPRIHVFESSVNSYFNQLNPLLQMIVSSNRCSNRTHRKCLLTSPKS